MNRQHSEALMTAVQKGAKDKANPTGEARAAKLIAWFNAGAGGRIRWGTPGDFDACVRIAGKHMTPAQAKGFCSNRHQDATGFRPGKAPGERKGEVTKAGRLAVLRRLLGMHPAAKADCPSCGEEVSVFAGKCGSCDAALGVEAKKAIDGDRTYDEKRELINRALKVAYLDSGDDSGYIYVQDLTDEWCVFELSGKSDDAGLYRVRYVITADGDEVAFGDPAPVERRIEYVPKAAGTPDDAGTIDALAAPVIKADESRRYTLMPLYPASPDVPTLAHLDAHGDFATADDVQAAVWDYVRKGDRTIRDQHRDGTAIGECVEIMCWPHPVTVPLTKVDGTTVEKTFGAGTAFMGVVWSDTGWEDVKKGRKTGLSLGGMATRVAVEMA